MDSDHNIYFVQHCSRGRAIVVSSGSLGCVCPAWQKLPRCTGESTLRSLTSVSSIFPTPGFFSQKAEVCQLIGTAGFRLMSTKMLLHPILGYCNSSSWSVEDGKIVNKCISAPAACFLINKRQQKLKDLFFITNLLFTVTSTEGLLLAKGLLFFSTPLLRAW